MPRNRFQTNNLNELNERRTIQANGGQRETFGNNRGNRRLNGNIIEESNSAEVWLTSNPNAVRCPPQITINPNNSSFSIDAYNSLMYSVMSASYPSTSNPNNYIKSYNYKPDKFIFSKTESDIDNPLFLGTEIEVDDGGEIDDNAKYVIDSLENCYVVHDGSLRNGFEIVTHPSTINFHKQMNYKDVFNELSKRGYKAHDTRTCGLHIHFNRDYLSKNKTIQDLCITKILFLLEKYSDNVEILARRKSNSYSNKIKRDKEDDSLLDLLYKAKGSNMYNSAKYNSVNLLHKDTVEIRVFKGTINYDTYIATLEFVKNLVDISKQVHLEDVQMVTFEEIININPTEYLISYLGKRGIKLQ